jgi:hypothetical protein
MKDDPLHNGPMAQHWNEKYWELCEKMEKEKSDNPNTISVNTWEYPQGVINQDVVAGEESPFASIFDLMVTQIMDTREAAIREMLVKMGWTPPAEKSCKTCGENPENGPCPPDCIPSFSHWIPKEKVLIPCPVCGSMVTRHDDAILCDKCGCVFLRSETDGTWHHCVIKDSGVTIEEIHIAKGCDGECSWWPL